MLHPTQKPEKLFEELIEKYSDSDDTVLDCFMGSGTTAIAAINTNRSAYEFEIKKNFFAEASKFIEEEKTAKEEIKRLGWAKSKAAKFYPVLGFQ